MKLALYFTFPYPDRETFQKFFDRSLKHRYDYLELGIPTDHPYYDGPVIRKTHSRAKANYSEDMLRKTVETATSKGIKVYTLVYYNHFIGKEREFLGNLKSMGFSGAIIPDLLTDYFPERNSLIEKMDYSGLSLIPFFTSSTPDMVIRDIASRTNDWIYHGLQPSTGIRVPVSIDLMVKRIKELCPGRELIFGFGINSLEEISELGKSGADGIAVGSSLVPFMETGDMAGFDSKVNMLEEGLNGI
ncbi:tryptophan synthase subunit alpha [Cuniculiplasma divulgatum]|jgi:tryptophan synthase alpha chain|uniref:tryptophan synthase n=1 Tax=Cuniculiplasma divulgatum TaxID=1673428 RepID=A0A1N5VRX1_9ARCH|nr:tryptophan synthase subunit alpha [Cuniculiplasma divulgatum]EQB68210.1 MAG: tryptophan synthase alpha chain [Thermoplasmatales archaeon Gpl]MCL4320741.1 tryptophan synthase subunit alpha [Candidatus Thermoplasmatota archaeon]WMT49620.1 MAG: tryptophan synthase subunit alpha [Thermoplasmatales archaeon]MCL6014269.1 tryptophan synthase subunit alpha [Candidatus Thermoplasmatota archaeon]SIM75753.1 tryptophan synthase subunit alpha [Cuniculiplasma divulgatum]